MPLVDKKSYSFRFASHLKELRIESEMSVDQIIERLNRFNTTSRAIPKKSGYYAWESGEGAPHFDLLPIIVKALKLKSIHDIMPEK